MSSPMQLQRVQEQLEAYRRTKRRENSKERDKEVSGKAAFPSNDSSTVTAKQTDVQKERPVRSVPATPPTSPTTEAFSWWLFALKTLLWLLLFGFFIQVEFGMVFLVSSGLYFMYASLRGSQRKPGEKSAYSVFNKNFERIEGTLSADQLEREIRYGPTAIG